MLQLNFRKLALTSAIAGIFLAGCGGGGGGDASVPVPASTMLSGTVAGGAAVIGTVLVTDSKGASKGGTIEADGHYSIDVKDMTGPFMLKAAGRVGNTSVTYYSAATTADVGGTVNVTPFTNLIVSNIAAQMAETYFADPANIAKIGTLITSAKLAAAQTALRDKLLPALQTMGIIGSIDLLRTQFAADHSGMDAVLDRVKVETDPLNINMALLKYASITIGTDDVRTPNDVKPVTTEPGMTTAVTDLQAVVTKLNNFAALFATSLPTLETLRTSGVFDTGSFMMGGKTFDQFATELSSDQKAIGLKFSNVAIALDASGTSGTLVAVISSPTITKFETIELKMVKVSRVWLVQGDGRIADMSINAQAERHDWTGYSSTTGGVTGSSSSSSNGLNIWIDPFAYNTHNTTNRVVSALVTGPGLPTNGVDMVQDVQNTWFTVVLPNYNNNLIPECGSTVNGTTGPVNVTTQCVTIAQALDNSEYTVVLKDGANASLNGLGYKLTLPKQPYATSTLAAAMFPAITAVTIDGVAISPSTLQTASGKSVNVTWTLPSGIFSEHMNIWANATGGASYFRVEKDLLPTATSALIGLGTFTPSGTAADAGVWLGGADIYGRRLGVSKSMSIQ